VTTREQRAEGDVAGEGAEGGQSVWEQEGRYEMEMEASVGGKAMVNG
jgi:hypothetical protein